MVDRGDLDVLVIGAGQAGLAAAHHLSRTRRRFTVVEGASAVGESWRRRYRSLVLFTPRRLSSLPGRSLSGDPEGYASAEEFAAYLERYAENLSVNVGMPVVRLVRDQAWFVAELAGGGDLRARNVIIATGGFQSPIIPPFADRVDVPQFTPETYRDASSVPEGAILVVGDGASGRDIAADIAATGRRTLLSTGKPRRLFPERLLGRNTWWWLDRLGILRCSPESWIGRRLRSADTFPDRNRGIDDLKRMGIGIVGRVTTALGRTATIDDGLAHTIDGIVWCIGYRDDVSWVDMENAHRQGVFLHREGVSPVSGLYFVGRPWQRNRASGLIMGVGEDARLIVDRLR